MNCIDYKIMWYFCACTPFEAVKMLQSSTLVPILAMNLIDLQK